MKFKCHPSGEVQNICEVKQCTLIVQDKDDAQCVLLLGDSSLRLSTTQVPSYGHHSCDKTFKALLSLYFTASKRKSWVWVDSVIKCIWLILTHMSNRREVYKTIVVPGST